MLPPKQRLELLERERLCAEADENVRRRLLLVCAPAGYGKTSTLIQLHERLHARGCNVAWLGVDADDNDMVRFLAHLLEAISRTGLTSTRRLAGLLGFRTGIQRGPASAPATQTIKTELLNALASLGADLFIFLDDFHCIRDPVVSDLVGAVLVAPLDHVHLVVAAREVPNLPVARLRARNEVHEIRSDSLAFSIQETQAWVRAGGHLQLSGPQIGALHSKTEGWPASLQLTSMALRAAADPDAFLADFCGADRDIAAFFVAEVLANQPAAVREFLLATSVLMRFNSSLAAAVLDGHNARAMIDHLESHNLFIFCLDRARNWYRYHPLFAQLLRKCVAETRPALATQVHARACEWLATNGYSIEAIDHAFAAGNLSRAGELIDVVSTGLFAGGQTATLSAYAERLPPAILKSLPRLQLEVAWENIICWRFAQVREELADIRRRLTQREAQGADGGGAADVEVPALRMKLAHRELMMDVFTDRLEAATKSGRAWVAEYGVRDTFMSASIAVAMMMCRREALNSAPTDCEWESLRVQFIEAGATYGIVFLDSVAGETWFTAGDLVRAKQALCRAREAAARLHGEGSRFAAMPGCELSLLLYELNDLDSARAAIATCRHLSEAFGLTDSLVARYTVLCRLAEVDGDIDTAHRALDAATQVADRYGLSRLHAHVAYERIRLLLGAGKSREAEQLTEVARYRRGFEQSAPGRQADTTCLFYAMGYALLAVERGDGAQGVTLLRRWLSYLRDRRCTRYSIVLSLTLARIQLRIGERLAARRSLIDALRWGVGGGFVRSFLDGGNEVKVLLQQLYASSPGREVCSTEYLSRLLAAFGVEDREQCAVLAPGRIEPLQRAALTARELDILRLSANHLVAREVADNLGLTQTTVKWYWRRIFAKLGVHRRGAAVRIARQRALIN